MNADRPKTPRLVPRPDHGPVRTIASLLLPHLPRLLGATLFQAIKDSPLWVLPVITAKIIDAIVSEADVGQLWIYVGLAILVLMQNYPNHLIYVRLYSLVYRSVAAELRNRLTAHLQELSIGFHQRRSAPVIQNKVVRDVENIELLLQQISPLAGTSASILIGSIAVTAVQVPAFLLVFVLTVPVAAALVGGMRLRSRHRNEDFRLRMEDLSSRVGEMATLVPITRAHGLEQTAKNRVEQTTGEVREAGLALDRLNGRFETTSWVTFQIMSTLCLGIAGFAALTHLLPITPGQVVLLSTYFGTLTSAVIGMVGFAPMISRGLESMRSINEVLRDPDLELNEGRTVVDAVAGGIRFDHVSFRYPDDDDVALTDLDLAIEPGETIAFVGTSGSGKSTTINLVLGFLRPTTGKVLFDGRDMEQLDMRSLRRFVSVVPQESVLFDGSIYENVTYGLDQVDEAHVLQSLRDANATEIIDSLPEGWHTRVGQRGARLSGGQRQRLAIARALVRDPRILLLDEATSALDSKSEADIKDALARLMRGRTSLVVAHRLSTIRNADRIVVMDRGRIAEVGSHEELIAANGIYYQLHNAQQT